MLIIIINNTPKIIQSNSININTLQQINFISPNFKEIQKLEIEAANLQNQLMQENIIDQYAKHKKTQTYLQAPVLNLQTKSKYIQQQSKIQNLNYLRILAIKKDRRLKSINTDELNDWITYSEFIHRNNPQEPTWDTFRELKRMSKHSIHEDQFEIKAYQNLNFKTPQYPKIQKLNIIMIQKILIHSQISFHRIHQELTTS